MQGLNLVAAAFSLTALSYGLARFAYGLLLPDIREDLVLGATAAGWIGGSAFAAYCAGIVLAFLFDARLGARLTASLAGSMATIGMGLVAVAQSATFLGLGIVVAGLGTGLTSPPLAVAVAKRFEAAARPRANGAVNAGTAVGIVLSGAAVLMVPGHWRGLYAAFATIGLLVTVWLWFAVPQEGGRRAAAAPALGHAIRRGVGKLFASTVLVGVASTSIWTFGANVMREDLRFTEMGVALAWIFLGASGTAGAATGLLTDRFGLRTVHRASVALMALAIAGLALAGAYAPLGFAAMGLFGMAYIAASGTFLLWGIELYEDRPALGLGLPFLVLAVGQTAGAPLFGAIWDLFGSTAALLAFAAIMLAATIWSSPRRSIAA